MRIFTPDELGSIFTGALTEVVSKISGFSLDASETAKDESFNEITGVMSLNCKRGGVIFISADEPDMRILCSSMIGVSEDEVTREDILDALCEIVNMTAGNAKVQLHETEHMFTLSTPFILSGNNMTIVSKKRSTVISRVLGNGKLSVKLKIVY